MTIEGEGPFTLHDLILANMEPGVTPLSQFAATIIRSLEIGETYEAFGDAAIVPRPEPIDAMPSLPQSQPIAHQQEAPKGRHPKARQCQRLWTEPVAKPVAEVAKTEIAEALEALEAQPITRNLSPERAPSQSKAVPKTVD